MTNLYWIYANISGSAKWHLVLDRRPGLYFIQEDFEEEEYDIELYREENPDREVIAVPNPMEVKNPLGICDEHKKIWNRVDCPLCDALFLHDRLSLAISVIGSALEGLSKIPDTGSEEGDLDADERARGQACINMERFLNYAKMGNDGPCECDSVGEGRCPRHGWEMFAESLRLAKKDNGE